MGQEIDIGREKSIYGTRDWYWERKIHLWDKRLILGEKNQFIGQEIIIRSYHKLIFLSQYQIIP
jgi:hypothetical protein